MVFIKKKQVDPNVQTSDESDRQSLFSMLKTTKNLVEQKEKSWGKTNRTDTKMILYTLEDQLKGLGRNFLVFLLFLLKSKCQIWFTWQPNSLLIVIQTKYEFKMK